MTNVTRPYKSTFIPVRSQRAMSPAELDPAIWLFRVVCFNLHPRFLKRDADDFFEMAGDNLIWSERAILLIKKSLIESDNLPDARYADMDSMEFYQSVLAVAEFREERDVIQAFIDLLKRHRGVVNAMLKESLKRLEATQIRKSDPVRKNVRHLKTLLDLTETESEILQFVGRMTQSQAAIELMNKINVSSRQEAAHILARILALKPDEVLKAIGKDSRLVEYGLIEVGSRLSDLEDLVKGASILTECLVEPHENLDDLIRHFIKPVGKTHLASEDFPHLETDRLALQSFLHGAKMAGAEGANFLFYGKPGTGKTEFAKLLSKEAGFDLYEVSFTDSTGEALSSKERLASLIIAERFLAAKPNSMILFDEIEDIFPSLEGNLLAKLFGKSSKSSSTTSKAWINQCLEKNKTPVIWVSNLIEQIDPAYLRRFIYHLEIRKPPVAVRSKIAEKYLSSLPLPSSFIRHVSEDASLTPAQIEKTAQFVKLSGASDEKAAEAIARRVIRLSKRAMGTDNSVNTRTSTTKYDLNYLNIEGRYPVDRIVRALTTTGSSTLCFYGAPGTGKTALAEHIAMIVNKPLLAKRASDILDMYVGGSEKNIAEMFREAENESAVLFLDEADSLLRDRKSATRSWEVTQVNEMLQQMERFDGIFICATNLFNELDQAALRRFSFKLQFNPMTMDQRMRMFSHEALEGGTQSLDTKLEARLAKLKQLTPGDFAAVKRQIRVMGEAVTAEGFMDMLESEHELKMNCSSKKIGFLA